MLLESVPSQHKNYITDLFQTTNQDIENGVMTTTAKEHCRFFHAWTCWLSSYFPTAPPDLQGIPNRKQIFLLAAFERMLGEEAFLVENRKFVTKRSRFQFKPSARPSSWTENQVPWLKRKANIQKLSNSYWRGTNTPTPQPNPNLPSR